MEPLHGGHLTPGILIMTPSHPASSKASFDLYPRNRSEKLDPELFRNPTAEYRGTPFWAWNNKLDEAQLMRQIDSFKEMGFGGFHMHPRTGMETEYLSDEFMGMVRACVEKARREQMLAWLYDEDRWPSGAAGGLVTRDHRYRRKFLLFTPGEKDTTAPLLARYEVILENGCLASCRKLGESEHAAPGATEWYAYLETARDASWFNNQAYVDTLSREAIQRFIEITHERYSAVVGDEFGKIVPAIFTDEPHFEQEQCLQNATDRADLRIPFTTDFLETYERAYGQKLEEHLPEIFWELPGGRASVARYRYHDHVSERFAEAFADTIGEWCGRHGIALTGHLMEEPTLTSQTASVGDAMRSYRSFQLPGIDMLCDWREYNTAKQAQSAARQYGRPGLLSELYGVTDWDFDFVGHKGQGDWQAALGVTVRAPHLAWVSMRGDAKRDYPAAIGCQSPWYREYRLIEDHFSRINTALTRGKAIVRVGVIHPVESYWLCFGPQEQTRVERDERELSFQQLTEWLLFGLIDFDFISESLLPSQSQVTPEPVLRVGEMAYEAVVVPSLRTIRSTTLDRLEAFADAGGMVIFAGEVPSLVDAEPSDRAQRLAGRTSQIGFTRRQILTALEPLREVQVKLASGAPASAILHQLRLDGEARTLFLCNTDRQQPQANTRIRIRGDWTVTWLDTMTGEQHELASERDGEYTLVRWSFPAHGSLLLRLEPGWTPGGITQPGHSWTEIARLADPVPVTLSEWNVLLLDQAQWKLNDGPWEPLDELLRLDNLARERLGLGKRTGGVAQPWTDTQPAQVLGKLTIRFAFESDIAVESPVLALEDPETVEIRVDGRWIPSEPDGWFVDESIRKIAMPALDRGRHEIALSWDYTRKTRLEWCYLLGDFGVEVRGRHARIVAPVRELAFGDWTRQGLPFYAGNVTYHCEIQGAGHETAIRVPKMKAPLLSIALDGKPAGKIAFAPFRVELGILAPGAHRLDITAYGNRVNAFGCIHNCDENLEWVGPDAWRSTGDQWSYEYQVRPMGVLVSPTVEG